MSLPQRGEECVPLSGMIGQYVGLYKVFVLKVDGWLLFHSCSRLLALTCLQQMAGFWFMLARDASF